MEDSGTRQEPVEGLREIQAAGSRVVYRERGNGAPVLLVHGFGGSGHDWSKPATFLAANYRLLVPDLPGFGRSEKPDVFYSLDYYINFIDEFTGLFGVSRFHLAGHSMGGQIAAAFALHRPEKVASLVLLDPAGVSDGPPWFYRFAKRPALVYAALRFLPFSLFRLWFPRLGPYYDPSFLTLQDIKEHYHSYGNKEGARAATRCFGNIIANPQAQLDGKLRELNAPALVIWGRQDRLLPPSMGEVFANELPCGRLVVLDNCGHCPQEEKPEDTAALCAGHFKEVRL